MLLTPVMCPSSGEVSLTAGRPISGGAVRLCTSPEEQYTWGGGGAVEEEECGCTHMLSVQ